MRFLSLSLSQTCLTISNVRHLGFDVCCALARQSVRPHFCFSGGLWWVHQSRPPSLSGNKGAPGFGEMTEHDTLSNQWANQMCSSFPAGCLFHHGIYAFVHRPDPSQPHTRTQPPASSAPDQSNNLHWAHLTTHFPHTAAAAFRRQGYEKELEEDIKAPPTIKSKATEARHGTSRQQYAGLEPPVRSPARGQQAQALAGEPSPHPLERALACCCSREYSDHHRLIYLKHHEMSFFCGIPEVCRFFLTLSPPLLLPSLALAPPPPWNQPSRCAPRRPCAGTGA